MLKAIIVTAIVVGIYLNGMREIDEQGEELIRQLDERQAEENCKADPTLMGCGDPYYK